MELTYRQEIADTLIIGCGAAGSFAAIEAADNGASVMLVSKGLLGKSGDTIMAGSGIQVALGQMDERDNPDVHFEDTIRAGAFLNNQKLVDRLVHLAPEQVLKLATWGAPFVKMGEKFYQTAPPGSTYPRVLELKGGRGGPQISRVLRSEVLKRKAKINIFEEIYIANLLVVEGRVAGAIGFCMHDGQFIVFRAKTTILATGGCVQIYKECDGSTEVTGDGVHMAYQAGAELIDMEFQQFFPYACYWPTLYRMAGFPCDFRYVLHAKLYNIEGELFMDKYLQSSHEWGVSGLRTATCRAILLENMKGRGSPHGGAYVDISFLPENLIAAQYEKTQKSRTIDDLMKIGIDVHKQAVEAGPASHYTMGGVRVDINCRTSVPGLYAAGEVAAGMDGAERTDGGSALMWCITMGHVTALESVRLAKETDLIEINEKHIMAELKRINSLWERKEGVRGSDIKNHIKNTMWECCSLLRNELKMKQGLEEIQRVQAEELPKLCAPGTSRIFNKGWADCFEAEVMTDISEMVLKAAQMRKESRGAHYREDYPKQDDINWLKNIVIKKEDSGMTLKSVPAVITKMSPPKS